jgi:hypothetical protein
MPARVDIVGNQSAIEISVLLVVPCSLGDMSPPLTSAAVFVPPCQGVHFLPSRGKLASPQFPECSQFPPLLTQSPPLSADNTSNAFCHTPERFRAAVMFPMPLSATTSIEP